MGTTMHRLQICLPESQVQYLVHRSKRDGISIAELIRRFVAVASESADERTDSLWDIAGIGEDRMPLKKGVPVSEKPAMYLADTNKKKRIPRPAKTTRRKPG